MSRTAQRLLVALVAIALVAAGTFAWSYLHRGKGTVLLVGDSLMFQSQQEMNAQFNDRGWSTVYVGGSGTGPLDDHGRWGRDLTAQIDAHHPKVVVIEACCNYRGPFTAADGSPVPPDSPAMYQAWERSARDLVSRAKAKGAAVFWVVTPPAKTTDPAYADYPTRIQVLDDVYRKLQGVTLIDWARTVAPFGFSPTLPSPEGPIVVRVADGLHLTEDGAALVAKQTWASVAPALQGR